MKDQLSDPGVPDPVSYTHLVSYGTPVFANREDYRNIPVCPMPYGQSMALMMLVEAGKHFRE